MNLVHENIWTYLKDRREPKKVTQKTVRTDMSRGHAVKTFWELGSKVATLGFLNRRFYLLFRGQRRDYTTNRQTVSLYPTIYRDERGRAELRIPVQKKRFDDLEQSVERLRSRYPQSTTQFAKELQSLKRQFELCWAILQHYEIVPTPYLDVTASLRVAASLALWNSDSGFVYVIGVPYPTGSISHVVDEDIKIVRLQAACPPSAKRPHFQEGFLVGSCYVNPNDNRANQNVSRRLIAKFHIPDQQTFWQPDVFEPIPRTALFPTSDKHFEWLK